MKNILLSIYIALSLLLSISSINMTVKEQDNRNEPIYQSVSMDFESNSDSAEISKYGIKPPNSGQLDIKRLFLKQYFSGLTENFGENAKGSCTYVALGMLLSYYDSYLSDNIIPEQYDVVSTGYNSDIISRSNSPGAVNDKILNNVSKEEYRDYINNLTKIDYYNILKEKFETNSLQVYLIELADRYDLMKINNGSETFGSNFNASWSLLSYYLWSVGYICNTDYTMEDSREDKGDDVKQFIKDNIDLGRPVFVCAENILGAGHAFICHDYDSNSNFYAHMGSHEKIEFTNCNPFTYYNFNLKAMAVDFKFTHTHSYNYMVGDKAYCYCDDAIEAYHNHSYGIPLKLNKQYHVSYCKCGLTKKGMHWIRGATNERYAKCGACGELLDLWSDIVVGIKSMNKTPNGSYISKSGIPVIAESEVEAYLNGTLKFGGGFSDYDYI